MKISQRTIMKIMRLYSQDTSEHNQRWLRVMAIQDKKHYLVAEFTYMKQHYTLVFSSLLSESSLDEFLPQKVADTKLLPNPLDPKTFIMPFQGKYVALFTYPSQKQRLDNYLSKHFDSSISRSLWQKHIKNGRVLVNNAPILSPSSEIYDSDDVVVNFPTETVETIDLPIIYEDMDVVVINKPTGVLTHAKGDIDAESTVATMLKSRTSFATNTNRAGIVHRLDRDTSGVIIGARNNDSAAYLQKQFANRTVKKTYFALVHGVPKLDSARIDLPISRNPAHPSTFRVDPKGKNAQTDYQTIASNGNISLIKLQPKTGRTHQLRVHLAYINTPIIGDKIYGKDAAKRLFLHAQELELALPSGENGKFTAPLPEEFLIDFPEIKI